MSKCIFCQVVDGVAPASKVYEDDRVLAFMDLFPVRPGHVLVIPRQHCQHLDEMSLADRSHLMNIAQAVLQAQKAAGLQCDGNNFLVNDGKAANQHVPHVHVHVLPRQRGDLPRVAFSFLTRMLNVFGMEKKRRQLDEMAARLARVMEVPVD